MNIPRRCTGWLVGVLAVAACQTKPPATATAANGAAAGPRPRLGVVLIVDQLASWMADQRWPQLDPTGGFARLQREGLTVHELRHPPAGTDTAPGHPALVPGARPADRRH